MANSTCVDVILKALRDCKGVLEACILTEEEKRRVFEVEEKAEENVVFDMCRTLNRGIREALAREYAVALVIDSSEFEYPHHPYMTMVCGEVVVGEEVKDQKRVGELKKNRSNFFLWENFVLYMPKLPRSPEERKKLRMVYVERPAVQLEGHPCVERSVFGTPSTEGDLLVKELLSIHSEKPTVGTCVVGFDLKKGLDVPRGDGSED